MKRTDQSNMNNAERERKQKGKRNIKELGNILMLGKQE